MSATGFPKPVPKATPALAPFLEAACAGRLAVQRCGACGTLRFPPREVCSRCWSRDVEWTDVSGRGEIFAFYVMHQVYHPGFAADVPYNVCQIDLDEGVRMVSNIIGVASADLRIGMRVEAVFDALTNEVSVPKFRAA